MRRESVSLTTRCPPRFPGKLRDAGEPGPFTWAEHWRKSRPRSGRLHEDGTPRRPFVLVAQQSLFDNTRAPAGQHTLWAYCHVPHASTFDASMQVEEQIERFAPGFRDCILARRVTLPADFERRNANLVGGDINGGNCDWFQLLARPILSLTPYRTPLAGVSTCVLHRRLRAEECMACAAGMQPKRSYVRFLADGNGPVRLLVALSAARRSFATLRLTRTW